MSEHTFAQTRQVPADLQETCIETDAYLRGYADAIRWVEEEIATIRDAVAYEKGKVREALEDKR